jgi:sporulation protein YlmC with PRC-barrel domain
VILTLNQLVDTDIITITGTTMGMTTDTITDIIITTIMTTMMKHSNLTVKSY